MIHRSRPDIQSSSREASLKTAATTGLFCLFTVIVSALISTSVTLRASRETVERYASVWEEDVARNLLLNRDTALFERIRRQILDLASDVTATGRDADILQAQGRCFAEQRLNVTLYGTPAGELRICRSIDKLILKSIFSPLFSVGILIGLIFLLWRNRRNVREESQRALGDLALRVAHDIRAPLMALRIATREVIKSENPASSLISSATDRISAIADEMLERGRTAKPQKLRTKTVQASISDIIREKKLSTPSEIHFEVHESKQNSEEASTEWSLATAIDFERVLSNLIQNSVEAITTRRKSDIALAHEAPPGRIAIETIEGPTETSISVRDNGIGIPKGLLSQVGEIGFSFGKINGHGIGLSSARRWIESQGGAFEISSSEGLGTEVRFTLRRQIQAVLQ